MLTTLWCSKVRPSVVCTRHNSRVYTRFFTECLARAELSGGQGAQINVTACLGSSSETISVQATVAAVHYCSRFGGRLAIGCRDAQSRKSVLAVCCMLLSLCKSYSGEVMGRLARYTQSLHRVPLFCQMSLAVSLQAKPFLFCARCVILLRFYSPL
jgi:hypothetical protein